MIFGSLRWRLLLTNVGVMAAILIALGGGILLVMDRLLIAQETATVEADLQRAAVEREDLSKGEFQSRHSSYTTGTFYVVRDSAGSVSFNPSGAPTAALDAAARSALAGQPTTVQVNLQPNQPALVASRVLSGDGQPTEVLQAGRSLVPVRSVEREALLVLLGAGLAALLVIVFAGWFLTERALGPIRSAMDRQVQFTSDASHELRTPLSVIDAGLQVLQRHPEQTIGANGPVIDSMAAETRRMARLVEDLLTLARVDSDQAALNLQLTNLSQMVDLIGRDLQVLAAGRGGRLEVDSEPGIEAQVDRDRIRQVLVILVDNALRHGRPGGTVVLRSSRAGGELRLEVDDDGPGIPADERGKVFERFYQLDGSRSASGAGLGLSIASWIVNSHSGRIRLLDNAPGLKVQISIPIKAPLGHAAGGGRGPAPAVDREAGPDPASTT